MHRISGPLPALLLSLTAAAGTEDTPFAIAFEPGAMGVPPPLNFGDGGGVIGDFDHDGIDDLAISARRAVPFLIVVGRTQAGTMEFKQVIAAPLEPPGSRGGDLATCALPPPELPLLIQVRPSRNVFVYSGWPLALRSQFRTQGVPSSAICRDVDGDGSVEIVVSESWSPSPLLRAYNPNTGMELWSTVASNNSAMVAAQLDGDIALELVAGSDVVDGATRAIEWQYAPGFGRYLAAGNLDGDGFDDFIGGGISGPLRGFGSDPLASLWSLPLEHGLGGVALANTDGGPPDEVIRADSQGINLWIHDAQTLAPIRTIQTPPAVMGIWYPYAGDLDGDAEMDLAYAIGINSTSETAFTLTGATSGSSLATWWGVQGPLWTTEPFVMVEGGPTIRAIVGWLDSGGFAGSVLWLVDGSSMRLRSALRRNLFRIDDMVHAQMDGDSSPELVLAGERVSHAHVEVLNPDSGSVNWAAGPAIASFANRRVSRIRLVDWDGVPPLDVVAALNLTNSQSIGTVLVALAGSDGRVLWESPRIGNWAYVNHLDFANVDEDPALELLVAVAGACMAFDIPTGILDRSYPCDASVLQRHVAGDGSEELMTFREDGVVEFHNPSDFSLLRTFWVGSDLNAISRIPPWNDVLLVVRDAGASAVDARTGEVLSPNSHPLAGNPGYNNLTHSLGATPEGSTMVVGGFSVIQDLRVRNDGLLRDGFEERPADSH